MDTDTKHKTQTQGDVQKARCAVSGAGALSARMYFRTMYSVVALWWIGSARLSVGGSPRRNQDRGLWAAKNSDEGRRG